MTQRYEYKQVIVLRTDLKMRRGKEIAQGAHASLKVVLENMEHPHVKAWLDSRFAKIAVGADSDTEMFDLILEAQKHDIISTIVIDAGFTEFNGTPTMTAIAIGPGPVDVINEITGHLKLR